MPYCTIIQGNHGAPHRFYPDPDKALAAAQRYVRRHSHPMEVAWCPADAFASLRPKVWLAYVTPEGTKKTEYWLDAL